MRKLVNISDKLNIKPDWLMLVFYIETNAHKHKAINHRARNAITGAAGLIQFMPATAKRLGTSTEALRNMTNVEQLDYVERYMLNHAKRIHSLSDCYLAVFFPLAIGKGNDWIIEMAGVGAGKIAACNPVFDLNKDNKISVGEIKRKIRMFLPEDYKDENRE
jgi:hypothetical protein